MTVRDKLIQEFDCAISAIFGEIEYEDYSETPVTRDDLMAIARKAAFYLDL